MQGHEDDEADHGTIRLALRHRREAVLMTFRRPHCSHNMVRINETKYRCIKCGKIVEAD